MLWTHPSDELRRGEKRLAAGAVEPLVVALIEISAGNTRAPQALDARAVARVTARADEVVVGELERFAKCGKALCLRIHELRDRHARSGGRLDVLQRVLIRSAQQSDVLAAQPPVARQHVCLYALERKPEMRVSVDVRDRGRDVGASFAHRCIPLWPLGTSIR